MLILGGFLLVGALGFGGVALDYGRVAELKRQLQLAADVAAHEHLTDTLRKDQNALQLMCRASVPGCTVDIESPPPNVSVQACAPYEPLLGNIYNAPLLNMAVDFPRLICASSGAEGASCTLPQPSEETSWQPITGLCSANETGEISYEQEIRRTASCSAGATSPIWSDWLPTGNRRNEINTCKAKCTFDSSRKRQFRWSESRVDTTDTCAPGEYGAKYIRVLLVREPQICANNDEDWTDWHDWRDAQGQIRKHADVQNACRKGCSDQVHYEYQIKEESVYCASTLQNATRRTINKLAYKYACDGTKVLAWNEGSPDSYGDLSCPRGGKAFTTPGEHVWAVPANVKNIAALAVGGGASGSVSGPQQNTFFFGPGEKSEVMTSPNVTAIGGGYDAARVSGQSYYNLPGNAGGCKGSKEGGSCGGRGGQQKRDGGAPYNNYYGWLGPAGTVFTYGGGGGGAAGYTGQNDGNGSPGNGGMHAGWTFNRTGDINNSASAGDNRGGGGGFQQKVTGGGGGGVGLMNYLDEGGGGWGSGPSPQGAAGGGGGSRGQSAQQGTDTLNTSGSAIMTAPSGGSYGGGGGGVMAPKTATTWDEGYGGGGGELSYRNDIRIPTGQETVTVIVGKGGASPAPVERRDGSVVYRVQPGAGAAGAVRIIWGEGCNVGQSRKFPDNFVRMAPYKDCPQQFCSNDTFCPWEEG